LSAPTIDPRYELLDNAAGPDTPPYAFSKARDREEGRVVTLQVVPADVFGADRAARQRFQSAVREAQTLDDAGILRVYGQGEAEDTGELYVARESFRGITLAERIRRIAPFTLAVATDFAAEVARALVSAHRAEVAHGDLRPCHVLLSPEGQIKVADFAYGALVAGRTREPNQMAYRAPEAGAAPSIGGDLYALGAMLYEMLTGALPLAGAARVTSPRDVNPGVPPALDGLVQKAMHSDPSRRYRSASAMLADLQAVHDALRAGKSLAWSPLAVAAAPRRAPRPSQEAAADGDETAVMPRPVLAVPGGAPGGVIPAAGLMAAAEEISEERQPMRGTVREKGIARERRPVSALGIATTTMFIIAVLAVLGLSWYAARVFFVVPNDIQVPSLIGKTFDDAKRIGQQQHFTLVESLDSSYSDRYPENQIYQQSPLPGRTIKADKEVTVFRSLGPSLLTVPALVGTTQDYAARALQQADLPQGNLTQEYSEKVPAGVVIRQSPDGATRVARNTAVNFATSKGKQPPDVPSDVQASANGPDRVTLNWRAASRAESYTVVRSLDGDTATVARGLAEARFTDTGLKPETTYSYTVSAVNAAGASDPSEAALTTTQAKVVAQPVLPPTPDVPPPTDTGTSVTTDTTPAPPSAARLRQFTVEFRVPRHPRRQRHVQVDVQDVTGTNRVHDEFHDAGDDLSVPIQAFGNKITFRIYLDEKLVKQQTF